MDVEKSGDVLDASETPQPEETVMEKEVVSESETPNEPTEPENPAAAEEEMAVNGHDTEVTNLRETEEVIVKETDTLSEKKAATEIGDNLPKGKSEMEPDVVTPPELDESSEKISDPVAALDMEPENTQAEQQPVPENDPEPLPMKTPLADSAAEPEPEKKAESVPEAQLPTSQEERTKRELEEAKLEVMKGHLEEMSLPLFFGWFLLSSVQDKVRCTSMDFVKTLDTLEAFKKHFIDCEFTGKAEKEVDLEQYFKPTEILHCTTKFCNYGKKDGAKEYAVKDLYGSVFELSLSALFVTPRTVGARVSLTEEQLLLWPADAEKEVEASASLPLGSRAHVSLGCAEGVEPVQTGLDLLEILAVQQGGQSGELVEEMELGSLTYYGEGRWLLSLREPICVPACFSSFYGPKEIEPAKKEPEKKKKPKCAIL
uniref:Cyclic nucleotide phosphodiesterase catalytic domain-containing protein n=1 Tax=Mola mola TaxID=94237 RepID=A0A3Q3X8L2_MOLML